MNRLASAFLAALLITSCAEKGVPDDRLPFRQHQSAEAHTSLDVPLAARWGTSSSADFDAVTRIFRLGAVGRRHPSDKKTEGSATVLTLRADGTYAWGWVRRTSIAEFSAWERGRWEAKGAELHLTPESQELDEGMLNTISGSEGRRENVDLAPRSYALTALTLRAGDDTWPGLRVAGPPPSWLKGEKAFTVELQGR